MALLIFIIILGVLIFVHELGHFSVAKFFGIRVDEFGMGFPPLAKKLFSRNGTDYTLNWIPFGGFVKIYGEDSLDKNDPDYQKSLVSKPWYQQIAVLIAGVTMNIILAWVLFSGAGMLGTPEIATGGTGTLTILGVASDTPAQTAGLTAGDRIIKLSHDKVVVSDFISRDQFIDTLQTIPANQPITLTIQRSDTESDIIITPQKNTDTGKQVIGAQIDMVTVEKLGFFNALIHGAKTTGTMIVQTTRAFGHLIGGAFTGTADMNSLTGPVGLVSVVGDASRIGFGYLLSLTAMISVNLAVINLAPFPALDGGRIVVVFIEVITRRKVSQKWMGIVNSIGFFILIGLMVIITFHDVVKLF